MPTPDTGHARSHDDRADGLTLWLLASVGVLIAVMLVAGQRGGDRTESVSAAGASSEEIAAGQTALAAVGCYAGEVDGAYGSQTQDSIVAFQRAAGIAVDGIFGPETLAALEAAVAADQTVCSSDTGDASGASGESSSATRQVTLAASSVGPVSYVVTSWDCTGDPGDLALTGSSDNGSRIDVAMNDGTGTLAVDGGDEQDNLTLNGEMTAVDKTVGSFSAEGVFTEPNFAGEAFTLSGTC